MKLAFLGTGLGLAITAYTQQLYTKCPSGGVCYSINIPQTTGTSGQGDIYFQIQGPSTKQWIGLGQGGANQMKNSNIFIVYADATGSNVTLSPRLGKGEFEPKTGGDQAQVFLLEGSGIANGKMTANIRCSNCNKWSTGSMDLTSSSTTWTWAYKSGNPIKSSSVSTNLDQHDIMDSFQLDLVAARGGSSLNPFLTATTPTPTPGSKDSGSSNRADEIKKFEKARKAHAIVMSLAFVLLFPMGAIIIRLFSFTGLVWVHAAMQIFAYMMAISGLGLGVFIALKPERKIDNYHPIIGILVIVLLAIQPLLGQIHHAVYKRSAKPSFWTLAHVALGRTLITLGIINGGLGLKLSGNTRNGEIAYGVVAGLIWVAWMAVAVGSKPRSKKSGSREKMMENQGGSGETMERT